MSTQGAERLASSLRPAVREAGIVATYAVLFLGVLPLLLWTLGARFDLLLRLPRFTNGVLRGFGWALALYGGLWMASAMLRLRTVGRGWPISHLPPVLLVSQGPYLRTRHPIYAGFAAAFVGAGLASGSWGRAVGAGLVLIVASLIYAVGFEEPRLLKRFGRAYALYCRETRIAPIPFGPHIADLACRAWLTVRSAAERIANRPLLIRTGPALWVTYGLFAALGSGVIAIGLVAALAGSRVPSPAIDGAVIAIAIAIAATSRLAWLFGHWRELRRAPLSTLRRVGFVSWGGYLAFLGGVALTAIVERLDPLYLTDHTVMFALAGHGIARLGCLTYGCCYGRESALGLRWWHPETKVCRQGAAATARVPTQLLSSAHSVGVAVLACAVLWRGAPPGTVTGVALVAYALGRVAIECLRADSRHTPWALTAGQIGAAMALVVGLVLLLVVPVSVAGGPAGLALDLGAAADHWRVVTIAVLVVFGAYGFHWKQVGSW